MKCFTHQIFIHMIFKKYNNMFNYCIYNNNMDTYLHILLLDIINKLTINHFIISNMLLYFPI